MSHFEVWAKLFSNSAERCAKQLMKFVFVALVFDFVQGWLSALLAVQVSSILQRSGKTEPAAEHIKVPATRIWKHRCTKAVLQLWLWMH